MVVVSRKHSEHHAYELYAAVDGTGGAFVCDEHGVWRKAVGAYTCLVDEATVIEAATVLDSHRLQTLLPPPSAHHGAARGPGCLRGCNGRCC